MSATTGELHRILRNTRIEIGSHTSGRHTMYYFWLDGCQIGNPVKGSGQATAVAYALAGMASHHKHQLLELPKRLTAELPHWMIA